MKNTGLIFLLFTFISGGCSFFGTTPDISEINVDFKLISFYEDLLAISPDSVEQHIGELENKYGDYLDAYSAGIIRIGHPGDKEYAQNLSRFLAYKPNREVFDTCRKVFSDKKTLKKKLEKAFRYYKYYYPDREIPDVYLHISGFNQSMVIDSGWVSISVEKYLGSDCIFYEWLETPVYLRKQMTPEMLVPDVMKAIGMTECSYNDSIDDLISQMVYHGKILQFVKHIIPDIPDTLLFGYSKRGMKWCRKNEDFMWSAIVEQKHLFSTDPMLIRKYIGAAPFTSVFGQNSPGRTGRFLGYRLMQSWIEKHPDKSFTDMMQQTDPHRILMKAAYRP